MFGLIESTVDEEHNDGPSTFQGLTCCHARLAKDILVMKPMMFVPNESDEPSIGRNYFNQELITEGQTFANNRVIKLPSKVNVHRYSVVAKQNNVNLITIYQNKRTKHKVLTCHDSFCRSTQPKERTLKSLEESKKLCPHMETLKSSVDLKELEFSENEEEREDFIDDDDVDDGGYEDTTNSDSEDASNDLSEQPEVLFILILNFYFKTVFSPTMSKVCYGAYL